jgi:ferredoxin
MLMKGMACMLGFILEVCFPMPKITIVNDKKEIEVPAGSNLRDEAQKAGVEVYSGFDKYLNCRGNGLCGTCRVLVKKGMENLSPKSTIERFKLGMMMSAIGHEEEMRLACQVKVNGDVSVEVRPALNLYGENFWQKPYPNK